MKFSYEELTRVEELNMPHQGDNLAKYHVRKN